MLHLQGVTPNRVMAWNQRSLVRNGRGRGRGRESMESELAWSRTGVGEGKKGRGGQSGGRRVHTRRKKKNLCPKPTGISSNPRKTIMPEPFLPESSY